MNRTSLLLSVILLLSFSITGCIGKDGGIVKIDSDDDSDCVFNLVEQKLGSNPENNDSDNDSYLDTYDRFPTDSSRYKLDNESFIRSSCYYGEEPDLSSELWDDCESNGSLSGNSQQSACEAQKEIGGKINLISAWISNNQTLNSSIDLVWEFSPYSNKTWEDEIAWGIICGNNESIGNASGNFVGTMDIEGEAGLENLSNIAEPGQVYMVNLKISSEDGAGCPITQDGEIMMWIHVNGGGSTYETLYITDTSTGSTII